MWRKILIGLAVFFAVVVLGYVFVGIHVFFCDGSLSDMSVASSAINGFSSVAIGAAGVSASFMAFYIQYRANIQLKKENQKITFRQNFTELLHRHQELVDLVKMHKKESVVEGHDAFSRILANTKSLYEGFKKMYDEYGDWAHPEKNRIDEKKVMKRTFQFIWCGSDGKKGDVFDALWHLVWFDSLDLSMETYQKKDDTSFEMNAKIAFPNYDRNLGTFEVGFENVLSPYFKRLFFLLQFVQKSNSMEEFEKKEYFDLIRSEMTDDEQTLLYYYWLSGYGARFENEMNHFLWDIIDDVYPKLIPEELRIMA